MDHQTQGGASSKRCIAQLCETVGQHQHVTKDVKSQQHLNAAVPIDVSLVHPLRLTRRSDLHSKKGASRCALLGARFMVHDGEDDGSFFTERQ